MKQNFNIAIGIVKTYFIQSVMGETHEQRKKAVELMSELLIKQLVPFRPNRVVQRKHPVNKSKRPYRYTY